MTIAEEFQRRCQEIPQNAANLNELEVSMVEEIHVASTDFHMVDDGKTLFAFEFADGSAMTALNCEGLRFALLTAKELRKIRKARHLTKKDFQDLDLALEAERVGRGSDDGLDLEGRGGVRHLTDESEEEDT
jgi:hypothetical protein